MSDSSLNVGQNPVIASISRMAGDFFLKGLDCFLGLILDTVEHGTCLMRESLKAGALSVIGAGASRISESGVVITLPFF